MAYLRLRQVCLVAPELGPVEAALHDVLDLHPCHRDPNVRRYGLDNVLSPLGTSFIEVVAPTAEGTAAGRFLQQRGGRGGYMLIFDCDDPVRYRTRALELGIRVAHTIDHVSYLGVQLHPRDTEAAMLEFNHTQGGESLEGPYHPAGPDWQRCARRSACRRLSGVGIEAPQPSVIGQRWAALFGLPLQASGAAFEIVVDDACIRFSPTAAAAPLLSRLNIELADPGAALQRARRRGCDVGTGHFTLAGVDFHLLPGG